jgi:hypothetical protein
MRCFVTGGPRCALLSAEPTCGGRLASLFWRVGGALLLAVPLASVLLGLLAGPADAKPQIKVNCKVYATNHVDPIAFSDHLHHQIGNTSTTNKSTANSLLNNRSTSCDKAWFTTAGWFPVERYESVSGVNVYYRAPGDQTEIKAIPKGLQLLGTREQYVPQSTAATRAGPLPSASHGVGMASLFRKAPPSTDPRTARARPPTRYACLGSAT